VAWRARQHPELMTEPGVFAPRVDWGRYLDETLDQAISADDTISLRHLRVRATGVRRDDAGVSVTTDDGQLVAGDRAPPATGRGPGGGGGRGGARDGRAAAGLRLGTRGIASVGVLRPRPVGGRRPRRRTS